MLAGTIQQSEKGISFLSFPDIVKKEQKGMSGNFFSFFGSIRTHVISFFQSVLPPTSAGLMLGIVFGIREQIPSEFAKALRSSGVLHVVAASGMNINIVIAMFGAVSVRFLKRQYALLFIIPAVLFYALLAGFDPPIVRACIMGLLAITASIFGRQYFGLLAIGMAAWLMLILWPYLLFDIGFQLSFLATLGIIVVKPLLGERVRGRVLAFPIIEDVRTTVAAQIATLPILLFAFGQYGLFSLLANALVLWMVPILMVLGLLGAVGAVWPARLASESVAGGGAAVLFLALPLLLLFESAVSLIGGFHADILFTPTVGMVVGYYLILAAGILFFNKRKKSL